MTDAREAFFLKQAGELPGSARAHFALGNYYLNQRRFEDAIAPFRRALEIEPRDGTFALALATALGGAGRPKQAARCFDELRKPALERERAARAPAIDARLSRRVLQLGEVKGQISAAMTFFFGKRDDDALLAAFDIAVDMTGGAFGFLHEHRSATRFTKRDLSKVRRVFRERRKLPDGGFDFRFLSAESEYAYIAELEIDLFLPDLRGDWDVGAGYLGIFLPPSRLAEDPERFAADFRAIATMLPTRSALAGYVLQVDDANLSDEAHAELLALLEAHPRLELDYDRELFDRGGAKYPRGIGWLTALDDAFWNAAAPVSDSALDVERFTNVRILRASRDCAAWYASSPDEDAAYRRIAARLAPLLIDAPTLGVAKLFRKDLTRMGRWLRRWCPASE